jgi:hypothetical protein
MNRNFQAIAEPFQTGQVAVPRGLGLEVGIVAHTSPNELEDAILQMPHDATDGTRILASAVDREITRLGRRHQIAACAAGIGVLAGGVFGYARNSTRYVQNAQRSAARRIARSTPPATE